MRTHSSPFWHRIISVAGGMMMLLLLLLLPMTALPVHAAKTYSFDMEQQEDIEIVILYEGKAPTISVKGPSSTYSKDSDYAKVEKQTGVLYLYLKEAAAGHWTITSDKEIDYTVLVWQKDIHFTSFGQEAPNNDKIKVKAQVSSDKEERYRWYIYAVSDASVTGLEQKVLLLETSGTTNKESSAEVSIKNLPDGQWTLTAEAVVEYGSELTAEARAAADKPFTVKGHTQQGDVTKIKTRVDQTSQTMFVDWQAIEDSYDQMLVSAVDANGEVLLYETFDKKVTSTDFLAEGDVTLRLMPLKRDEFQTMYTLPLSYHAAVTVTIDTPETTGDLMVQISYQAAADQVVPAEVTINGKTDAYRFSGTGTLSLPLEPMENNKVSVTYAVSDSERYTVTKTIHVQSAPVALELYGVEDTLVTDKDTLTLTGRTEAGVVLRLNDTAVTVDSSGEFAAEATLTRGDNILSFTAESPYGTRTERTVRVIRTTSGGSAAAAMNQTDIAPWLYWVFGGFALLLTVGTVWLTLFLWRKKPRRPLASLLLSVRMFLLLVTVLTLSAGVFCLYRALRAAASVSGEQLVDRLSANDYDGLDQVLQVKEAWFGRMWLLLSMAVVALVLFIVLTLLLKKRSATPPSSDRPIKMKKPKKPKKSAVPSSDRPQFVPGQPFPSDDNPQQGA